jgi:group I intron endonuclease
MQEIVFIYTLENPITNEVRYVGKTVQKLDKRLNAHIYESRKKNNHKCNWINSLSKKGEFPTIKLIDIVPEEEWEFWESYWIEQLKMWGFNLVNGTPGGEGYKHTDETKEKIKKATSGKNHYLYGKKRTDEWNKKLSESLKGNQFAKGFKHSNETKKKVGDGVKKYYKKNPRTKEHNEKIAEKNKQTKYNPVYQFDINNNLIQKYNSVREASVKTNSDYSTIYACLKGKLKQCNGFIWSRVG